MTTYSMRGQTYEFKRPANTEEASRLQWLADRSSNPQYRKLAKQYLDQGIEVEVSDMATTTLEQPLTEHFYQISMVARQVLRRRGLLDGDAVTFPADTQKNIQVLNDPDMQALITYVLPDGAKFEYVQGEDGILEFLRK